MEDYTFLTKHLLKTIINLLRKKMMMNLLIFSQKKLYSKGFKSLVPKLNETTIEQYAQMHIDSYIDNTIMQKNSSSDYDDIVEHFDDVEDIFGDEVRSEEHTSELQSRGHLV